MNSLRYYDLGFAEVFIFNRYLIAQVKEGYTVGINDVDLIYALIDKYFKDRKFIYILTEYILIQ